MEAPRRRERETQAAGVAEARKKWQSKLQQFFLTTAKGRPFHELAGSFRDKVAPVVKRGIGYAGYVDDVAAAHLKVKGPGDAPSVVWV